MLEAGWLSAVVLAAALASAGAGMAWLALAMDGHWEQVHGSAPRTAQRIKGLRIVGGGGLVASLLLCLLADHATMAALVWIMVLAAAVLVVAMTLAWRPGWLRIVPVGPVSRVSLPDPASAASGRARSDAGKAPQKR